MESGGRYSYDHIPQIVALKNELKEREKLHQLAYKNMHQGLFINEITGEVYEPAVFKPSESYVKLIKAKK
jgi:hypothetical protein